MKTKKKNYKPLFEFLKALKTPLKILPAFLAALTRLLPVLFDDNRTAHVRVTDCGMLGQNIDFFGNPAAVPDTVTLPGGYSVTLCKGVTDASTLAVTADFGKNRHLAVLGDGMLLCTFCSEGVGGIRAKISRDAGKSWSDELMIDSLAGRETMYITSVQAADGSVITVFNHRFPTEKNTRLKYVHWILPAEFVPETTNKRKVKAK